MAQISKPQSDKTTRNNVADQNRHAAERVADATHSAAGKAEDMGRNGLAEMQRSATATLETQRAVAGQAAQDTKEFGQALSQLFNEQAQHNLEVLTKLTRTFSPAEAAQIQADFLRASMDRSVHFTRRYFETAQATMFSAMAKMPTDQASTSRR
ncbi:phasin family protein [Geminicoccus harenae]|uniref:phasin family protein n=1 Tax=Geminicoccus harenae TaxID=2498453 RepID=UPI00168A586F|nr:phasin family protein [Geminicoccus harenae]